MQKIVILSLLMSCSAYAMEQDDIERNRLLDQIREAHEQRMERLAQEHPMDAESAATDQSEFWNDERLINIDGGWGAGGQVQRVVRDLDVERIERIELSKQVARLAAKLEVMELDRRIGGQFPSLALALLPVACYGAWHLIGSLL